VSSDWQHGTALLAHACAICCNARDRNKRKTAITCFAAAASISFSTNRVTAPVNNDAPSVGRQASKNSGSGIASRVCVGPAARCGVSKNSTIDMSQQKKKSTIDMCNIGMDMGICHCEMHSIQHRLFQSAVIYNECGGMHCITTSFATQAMVSVCK